jgi:hypothetical protein
MIQLRGHASADTTEHKIGQTSHNVRNLLVGLTREETGHKTQATSQDLQAVVATNQTHIILIQTQVVVFT